MATVVALSRVAVRIHHASDIFAGALIGALMGDTVLDQNGVKQLAALPSLDQLRGKIIGLIQAPATKIAQLATAPAAKLARVFGAYATKDAA